ncbi:MAG: lamin tail domain-containing protein [Marinilabiliaceae bacterium]|nr:lamin tail domain-containing protein [Marinilabiliaceae bacterium]
MSPKQIILLLLASTGILACAKDESEDIAAITVVINELMPKNSTTQADQDGEYDDWIELYNTTGTSIDLSGYFLSDSKKNITKWKFPQGTTITAKGYLIIWADGDTLQSGLHTNYKLSAEGEKMVLATPEQTIIDQMSYPAQAEELSYARVPDGTGEFVWQAPTYNATNGKK